MKKRLLILTAVLLAGSFAYAQKDYVMFETIYLTPKKGEGDAMVKAILEHNKMFHPEGSHEAFLQYVVTGQNAGDYVWGMGPLTFSDLDDRPTGDSHDDDWSNAVGVHIEKSSMVEYWHKIDEISYTPNDTTLETPMLHIRIWDVKSGHWDEVKGVMKQVHEVNVAKQYPGSWSVYYNEFASGDHRDVAAVGRFKNWASFDQEDTWVEDFEAIHGEGSWKAAMDVMRNSTNSMIEEIRKDVTSAE